MKHMIECAGVGKTFSTPGGAFQVVRYLTVNAEENEFLVLFGPGQCGKTTIINLIAGLETAASGNVVVNGKRVLKPDPERGVVFQTTALFNWLTAMGNVEYGPRMAGVHKTERRRRAQHYIDLVGLQGFEDAFPVQLSGGMQRRISIARAFATEPELLLMDEPYGQLDIELRFKLEDELVKLWQLTGTTVIFITHNIEEAVYLGSKIMVLSNKPTRVKELITSDLPRPRDITSPDFVKLRNEVTDLIKWW